MQLIFFFNKYLCDHVTPCLIEMDWLQVIFKIQYKIAKFNFKCLNDLGHVYLSNLLYFYTPSRTNLHLFTQRLAKYKILGERYFLWQRHKFRIICR